ncbi:MAG TPA: hypothetical protein ENI34_07870 [candidate division WOR-3 bacterium]|uniref:DUF2147 domain-containing protein n=1 Tax=candidate division WOR-3 bacterium TaxID=2052148 RepID=A0A9C9EN69_UNCW3|nr:hypothetical protein [candidate division WOR-3 bacterium]
MRRIIFTVLFLLFLFGCVEDPIIGQWERFGDDAEGTIVQVEVVGKMYHGKLIKPAGILNYLGFAENDIKWRDIEPVGTNKWKGKDLIKKVDMDGNITSIEYKDVYFTLQSDGILVIRKFAKESKLFGEVQKWRRIQ